MLDELPVVAEAAASPVGGLVPYMTTMGRLLFRDLFSEQIAAARALVRR